MLRVEIARYEPLRRRILCGDGFRVALVAYSWPNGSAEGILLRRSAAKLPNWEYATPGRTVGYRTLDVEDDDDEIPQAVRSPMDMSGYRGVSPSQSPLTVNRLPRKGLAESRSSSVIVAETLRHHSTSRYVADRSTRAQGYAESQAKMDYTGPTISLLLYTAYRKPTEAPQQDYMPYRPAS
ncbi:hypothetical protein K458DRAFT_430620 [Lentithecium fluviatile CBS 122367]|uniref:Uncharacterized protein n=1 Tax=Lentithecium fluviatile CBS 122367 TaxID=1168545 RepID=A0A6G1J743_9PLEO|nr:hypothetical protein K458DRAFT_430620 [Lentithecium fluviatile CBS 122367]